MIFLLTLYSSCENWLAMVAVPRWERGRTLGCRTSSSRCGICLNTAITALKCAQKLTATIDSSQMVQLTQSNLPSPPNFTSSQSTGVLIRLNPKVSNQPNFPILIFILAGIPRVPFPRKWKWHKRIGPLAWESHCWPSLPAPPRQDYLASNIGSLVSHRGGLDCW